MDDEIIEQKFFTFQETADMLGIDVETIIILLKEAGLIYKRGHMPWLPYSEKYNDFFKIIFSLGYNGQLIDIEIGIKSKGILFLIEKLNIQSFN